MKTAAKKMGKRNNEGIYEQVHSPRKVINVPKLPRRMTIDPCSMDFVMYDELLTKSFRDDLTDYDHNGNGDLYQNDISSIGEASANSEISSGDDEFVKIEEICELEIAKVHFTKQKGKFKLLR